MKTMKHIGMLLMVLPMGLVLQNCSDNANASRTMEQIYKEDGLPVKTEVVQIQSAASAYSTHTVLTGIQESTASASVADKIEKIHRNVGDTVKKDDIILTFPLNNPAAQYTQAKVNVEHMRTTYTRMESLYESGGISRQELDNVKAQLNVAEANWDAVQQTVKVRAPISGVITHMGVQVSDNVAPGDVLFTVARTGELKAQLWVPENQAASIRKGDKAVAGWNGRELTGSVQLVDLSLNTGMQAFGVQLVFDNSEGVMYSGVNAEVRIFSEGQAGIQTARKNLVKSAGQYYAYKVEKGQAVQQPVALGRSQDLNVEIIDGLKEGDEIITEGLSLVEDGQKVRVVN